MSEGAGGWPCGPTARGDPNDSGVLQQSAAKVASASTPIFHFIRQKLGWDINVSMG